MNLPNENQLLIRGMTLESGRIGIAHGHFGSRRMVIVKRITRAYFTKKMKPFLKETMKHGVYAVARVRYVLEMRGIIPASGLFKLAPCATPCNSLAAKFSMEDDLINHILQTLTIMSSGAPMRFYDDPFGRNFLAKLEPRHRPIFRKKLVRLVRCVVDTQSKEVRLSMIYSVHILLIYT